ncbi:hypothetical protein TNCV_782201 [Trichonephila clavipes]|nr:hypothetical protein TNCV_782201 [Trichonephila clavipes]
MISKRFSLRSDIVVSEAEKAWMFLNVENTRKECRRPDIQIYPRMGQNFQGDMNLGISNCQVSEVIMMEETVDGECDSFCRSLDKSIRQASNGIPFCSNTSLNTRD